MMWLVLIVLGLIGGAVSAIPAGAGIPLLGGLGVLALVIVLVVLANKNEKKRPRPKTGVPLTPPPTTGPWPDLRASDVFEGKR